MDNSGDEQYRSPNNKKAEDQEPELSAADRQLEMVNEYAKHYQDGFATIKEVFNFLPDSDSKRNAVVFYDTHVLWMQQAFETARAQAMRMKQLEKRK